MSGDEIRDALAEALRVDDYPPFWQRGREGIAELLVPTVRALIAAEREVALAEAESGLLAHRDPGVRPGDGDQFGKGWNSALNFAADWIARRLRARAAAVTDPTERNRP